MGVGKSADETGVKGLVALGHVQASPSPFSLTSSTVGMATPTWQVYCVRPTTSMYMQMCCSLLTTEPRGNAYLW